MTRTFKSSHDNRCDVSLSILGAVTKEDVPTPYLSCRFITYLKSCCNPTLPLNANWTRTRSPHCLEPLAVRGDKLDLVPSPPCFLLRHHPFRRLRSLSLDICWTWKTDKKSSTTASWLAAKERARCALPLAMGCGAATEQDVLYTVANESL